MARGSIAGPAFGARIREKLRQALGLLSRTSFDLSSPEGRGAERHRRMLLTSIAAAASKVISVATLLVTVPLTLHYLGAERYGMWGTLSSFIALLTFADFGIGNGLLNKAASAHGRDDAPAVRGYVSSAFFVLLLIAAGFAALFCAAYGHVDWYRAFNVEGELARAESGPAIAVLAVCVLLNLPLGVVQKTQIALQQGFVAHLWNCLASLLALGAVVAAIQLEAGLPWLVGAFVGAPLAAAALNFLIFFGFARRDLAPRLGGISREGISAITSTGLLFVALQMIVAAAYGSDNIIIAHTLGAERVAEYAVPAQMFTLVTTVLAVALGPLWPAYGEAISRRDDAWVRRTLLRSLVFSMGFAAVAGLALVLATPAILKLWVGSAVQPPLLLLIGLALWRVIDAGGNAVTIYLNGANQLRFQLAVLALAGVAAVVLKISLTVSVGISGMAWGAILSYLGAAVPTIWFLRKRLAQ